MSEAEVWAVAADMRGHRFSPAAKKSGPAGEFGPETRTAGGALVVRGFGAPLWVLLMSVIGAGVFTVSLIIKQIKGPPAFDDVDKARERVHRVPVARTAGSASQQVTMGLAALAAGVALNLILDKAFKAVEGLLT